MLNTLLPLTFPLLPLLLKGDEVGVLLGDVGLEVPVLEVALDLLEDEFSLIPALLLFKDYYVY